MSEHEVTLTARELSIGALVGSARWIDSKLNGRKARADLPTDDPAEAWNRNIEGALGEMALAKGLNVYWEPTVNTFQLQGDGCGMEVKTRSKDWYELFVRPHEIANSEVAARRFVLVTGVTPTYRLRGWIFGRDAKREEWLKDYGGRGPAYFVPTEALFPIGLLREELEP